jgi:hypothetical protein
MRSAYLLCALSIKPAVAKISTASKTDHFRTKLIEANSRGEETVEFENKLSYLQPWEVRVDGAGLQGGLATR